LRERTFADVDRNVIAAPAIKNVEANLLNRGRKVAPSGRDGSAIPLAAEAESAAEGRWPRPIAKRTGVSIMAINMALRAARIRLCWMLAKASFNPAPSISSSTLRKI
jgi:hypothetical protein